MEGLYNRPQQPFTGTNEPMTEPMQNTATTIELTDENLRAVANGYAGWSAKQLAVLGVSWPPKRGWLKKQIGRRISVEDYRKLNSMRKRKPGTPIETLIREATKLVKKASFESGEDFEAFANQLRAELAKIEKRNAVRRPACLSDELDQD